jgi:DNA-binding NtrC family response regulator
VAAGGRFRRDLYYRLSVFTIHLPPLRERGDDLVLLVQHYLRRYGRELGKEVKAVAPEAMELLRRYPWPGNVRELQSVLKQSLLLATGPVLLPDFLPPALQPSEVSPVVVPDGAAPTADPGLEQFLDERIRAGSEDLYAEAVRRLERSLLTHVLRHTGGNQLQAARILGITRGSLRSKLRDLGIRIDRTVSGGDEGA